MKIKYILFLMSVMFAFASCNDDTDPVLPHYEASVLTHPENGTLYELKQKDADNELFPLSWTAYKQKDLLVGPPTYCVQVDLEGNDFSRAKILSQVSEIADPTNATVYTSSVVVKDLNSLLINELGQQAGDVANIEFRVVTKIGDAFITSSTSNVFKAKVVPYENAREALHFIGNMFGESAWDNGNYKFVMFRTAPDDIDTYTGKFAAASEFKFISNSNLGSWDLAYGSAGSGVLSSSGGNITDIATEGYYTVTVDLANLKYTIKPYDASKAKEYKSIGLVGAFNNWGDPTDVVLTKSGYDSHIWTADNVTLPDGEVKFRADSAWDTSWGGTTFPYGGGSGENILVVAGKYFVKFNDLTGQYVFYKK
jgi:hypothetical protein